MNQEAYQRGFVKAAMANGLNLLEGVNLLKVAESTGKPYIDIAKNIDKVAFDPNTAMSALKMGLPRHWQDLAYPAALGAGVGALGGAVTGGQHKGRNALIGGTIGGLYGGTIGAASSVAHTGADKFKAIKNQMHGSNNAIEKNTKLPEAANTKMHYPFWDKWWNTQGEVGQALSKKIDPVIQQTLDKDKLVQHSSYLQALLGNQNPVSDFVMSQQDKQE